MAAAAGWGGAWRVRAGPGLVWMRGVVFAAAQMWGGRLRAAGHRSSSAVCRCWLVGGLRGVVRWRADSGVGVLLTGAIPFTPTPCFDCDLGRDPPDTYSESSPTKHTRTLFITTHVR